jgi:hypothetical protein
MVVAIRIIKLNAIKRHCPLPQNMSHLKKITTDSALLISHNCLLEISSNNLKYATEILPLTGI